MSLVFYSSPYNFRVINAGRIRWEGHVDRNRGDERCLEGFGEET
jgi:hypothetical protein